MAMKYVKLFYDWYDMLSGLTKEEMGEMFEAIMRYGYDGTEIETTGVVARMFPFFKRNIDRNEEAYEKMVEKRREAGRKGGKAKQMLANESKISKEQEQNKEDDKEEEDEDDYKQQDQENDNALADDFDMNDDLERINNFIIEKGLTCDAQEFYDYYSERNWEIGGKKIDNWKGLLVSWDKSNRVEPLKSVTAPPKKKENSNSTFDVDDFFQAALNRKYEPKHSPR